MLFTKTGGIRGSFRIRQDKPDSGEGVLLGEVMAAYGLLNSDNSNEGAGKPSTVLVVVGMFRKPLKGWIMADFFKF